MFGLFKKGGEEKKRRQSIDASHSIPIPSASTPRASGSTSLEPATTRVTTPKSSLINHARLDSFGANLHLQPSTSSQLPQPRWAIVDDIFSARFQPTLRNIIGAWEPLKAVSLSIAAEQDEGLQAAIHSETKELSRFPSWQPLSIHSGVNKEGHVHTTAGRATGARATRPRLLFQYKPYCQQAPLLLQPAEISAVIEAVLGTSNEGMPSLFKSPDAVQGTESSSGSVSGNARAIEAASILLIKLIIDLYLKSGPKESYVLVSSMFVKSMRHQEAQANIFDVIYNLSIHGEMLYAGAGGGADGPDGMQSATPLMMADTSSTHPNWHATVTSAFRAALRTSSSAPGTGTVTATLRTKTVGEEADDSSTEDWPVIPYRVSEESDSRTDRFHQWLRLLLYKVLSTLPHLMESVSEETWASALSCFVHLTSHQGLVVRAFVEDVPLDIITSFMHASERYNWSVQLQGWLITLAMNLLYVNKPVNEEVGVGGGRHSRSPSISESVRNAGDNSQLHRHIGSGKVDPQHLSPVYLGSGMLNCSRVNEFGGVAAVVECYRYGPSENVRRNAFSILFELAVSTESGLFHSGRRYSMLSKSQYHAKAHSSEIAALGATLLELRADVIFRPFFMAGLTGILPQLAGPLCLRMAHVQNLNPGRILSVPPAFVSEVLECFEDMIESVTETPTDIECSVQQSLEGDPGGLECLEDVLKEESLLGCDIAKKWLLIILIARAEQYVATEDGDSNEELIPLPGSPNRLALVLSRVMKKSKTMPDTLMWAIQGLLAYIRLKSSGVEHWKQDEEDGGGEEEEEQGYGRAGSQLPIGASATSMARQHALDGRNELTAWQSIDGPQLMLKTLSTAVDWLLLAPKPEREKAMLTAAEALMTVTSVNVSDQVRCEYEQGTIQKNVSLEVHHHHQQQQQQMGGARRNLHIEIPTSPIPMMKTPFVGVQPTPTSGGWRSSAGILGSPAILSTPMATPQSFSMNAADALSPVAVSTPGGAETRGDAALYAEPAGIGQHTKESLFPEAHDRLGCVEEFLKGNAVVPRKIVLLVPPILFKTLFQELKPDTVSSQVSVHAQRPLWDARAAVLLLLMARCGQDDSALAEIGGGSFFAGLLDERDARLRNYSAFFVLRGLMHRQPQKYRAALKLVAARAQQAGDERLIRSPFLQLQAMLEQNLIETTSDM